MKLCIIQAVLPLYVISFFNRISELYQDIELVVVADLESTDPLNQYRGQLLKFSVVHVTNTQWGGIVWRAGLLKALRLEKADVVVFSGFTRDVSQLLAMMYFSIANKQFAVWGMFHRIGGPRFVTNAYFRIVGLIADRCLTYSRIGAVNLVGLGVSKQKIGVVGTAIDESKPQAQLRLQTQELLLKFRDDHDLKNKHVILQVVRLSRIKRPEILIHAAAVLKKIRNDLVFILIGDGEMRAELESLVSTLGLEECFRFVGAIYDESELSRWYLCSEVFVVPTFIGLSAHHAMSYGVPVVTDDSIDCQGSEFDILAPGLNSLTYREGDAEDLARVLAKVVADTELQSYLAFNARKTIENVHNLDNKAKSFVSQVKQIRKLANF
jgi:glycosyltransferase involved in cell wall biosynthesis